MERLKIFWDVFKHWGSDSVWPDIGPTILLWSAGGGFLLYLLIYGLFLSPTRNIPGPLITRFSSAWFLYRILRGYFASDVVNLHRKYGTPTQLDASTHYLGPVVRLSPKHVDVETDEILQDAWGGQNELRLPWDKDLLFRKMMRSGMKVDNIGSAGPKEAIRMRRLIGPPFSRKFLLDQGAIFKGCVKTVLHNIERLSLDVGVVDVSTQFRRYALEGGSISYH
jgi:hypothetical protein